MHQDATGAYVFQTGIDIADADRDFALKTMARAGALLFQKLFFGPAAGDDSKRIGNFLRDGGERSGAGASSCRSSPRPRRSPGACSTSATRRPARRSTGTSSSACAT